MIEFNSEEEFERTGLRLTDEQFDKEVIFANKEAKQEKKNDSNKT